VAVPPLPPVLLGVVAPPELLPLDMIWGDEHAAVAVDSTAKMKRRAAYRGALAVDDLTLI
jgi:hypothetical protein